MQFIKRSFYRVAFLFYLFFMVLEVIKIFYANRAERGLYYLKMIKREKWKRLSAFFSYLCFTKI